MAGRSGGGPHMTAMTFTTLLLAALLLLSVAYIASNRASQLLSDDRVQDIIPLPYSMQQPHLHSTPVAPPITIESRPSRPTAEVPPPPPPPPPPPTPLLLPQQHHQIIQERDARVAYDEMYPPLSRAALRPHDTFRPAAYLVAEEDSRDVWKLYARERRRGGQSDFYAVSADRNFDIKVTLNHENVQSSPPLRDVYNLPTTITVQHPMFRAPTYKLVELTRGDWGDMPNYV